MKWIKCTDRLPEEGRQYLISYGSKGRMMVTWGTAIIEMSKGKCDFPEIKITHWMELPKAPIDDNSCK